MMYILLAILGAILGGVVGAILLPLAVVVLELVWAFVSYHFLD